MFVSPLRPLMKPFWQGGVIMSTAGMMASAMMAATILFSTLLRVIGRVLSTVLDPSLGKMHRWPKLNSGGGRMPLARSLIKSRMMGAAKWEKFLYRAKGMPSGPGDVFLFVLMWVSIKLIVGRRGFLFVGMVSV